METWSWRTKICYWFERKWRWLRKKPAFYVLSEYGYTAVDCHGDGATDDSENLREAMRLAQMCDGKTFVPRGRYKA